MQLQTSSWQARPEFGSPARYTGANNGLPDGVSVVTRGGVR